MERRNFLKSAAIVGLAATAHSAYAQTDTSTQLTEASLLPKGTILHSVYFWLKEGLTATELTDFPQFFEALRAIPEIHSLSYGKPAATNPRPVVDQSWSYNLIVTFSSIEDINVYETHPTHLKAIEKFSKYWTKVEVKDTQL